MSCQVYAGGSKLYHTAYAPVVMVVTLQHWKAMPPPKRTMAVSSAYPPNVQSPLSVAKKYPVS